MGLGWREEFRGRGLHVQRQQVCMGAIKGLVWHTHCINTGEGKGKNMALGRQHASRDELSNLEFILITMGNHRRILTRK